MAFHLIDHCRVSLPDHCGDYYSNQSSRSPHAYSSGIGSILRHTLLQILYRSCVSADLWLI